MGHVKKYKWVFLSGIILLLSFTASDDHFASAALKAKQHQQVIEKDIAKEFQAEQKSNPEITHKQITALTEQFMDILLQEVDENYKVKTIATKAELMDQFEMVTTKETAKPYVDFFFDEKADGLYILPTEAPAWFNTDNQYDVIQLKDNKISVVQENNDEMYGDYTIAMEFTYDRQWKITDISYL